MNLLIGTVFYKSVFVMSGYAYWLVIWSSCSVLLSHRSTGVLVWYTSIVSLQVSVPKNTELPVHFVSYSALSKNNSMFQ